MPDHAHNPFIRFPRTVLFLSLLLCAPFFLRLAGFEVSSDSRVLLEGDQRNLSSYEKVRDILADVEVLVISLEHERIFSPDGIEAVRRVSEAFERLPGVRDVKSLTHSYKPVRRGLSFDMVPLVPDKPLSQAELADLQQFSLHHPLIRDVMVSRDGRHSLITVTYRREFKTPRQQRELREQVEAVLAPFRAEGLRLQTVALPLVEEEIRTSLWRDIKRFLPAAMALVLLILWLTFGSLRIVAVVLLNQTVVLLLLPGIITAAGLSVNVFSVILFPLLGAIHLTLLAHLFTAYQRAVGNGESDPVRAMLRQIFKASAFAALTTGIGLGSLVLSEVEPVRNFGILGALGIATVFAMTFGPGVSLLVLLSGFLRERGPVSAEARRLPSMEGGSNRGSPRWPGFFGGAGPSRWLSLVQRFGRAILAAAFLAAIVAIIGITQLRTDVRAVEFLNPNSPARLAVEEFDRVYGGINVVQIELDAGREGGANQLGFLRYVERVHDYAAAQPEVSGVYSYAQLLAMMNQIWEGGRPGALELPDTPLKLSLFVVALKSYDYPFLTALVDPGFRTAYLVIRTPDMPVNRYLEIVGDITAFAREHQPQGTSVSAARGLHSILESDRRIMRSQGRSVFVTLGVIAVVLALLWRSVWLAALSVMAGAMAVGVVLAIAGIAGVPLNSITVMVGAIALGIAVDDAVHFLTHWREQRKNGAAVAEAVRSGFEVKGRPIVCTSLVLITVLSVFWLSSFPPIVHFGMLSSAAFGAALLSILCFIPAVLLRRGERG